MTKVNCDDTICLCNEGAICTAKEISTRAGCWHIVDAGIE